MPTEVFEIKYIIGMPSDAVLYGLFGALIMVTRSPKTSRAEAFGKILSSVVIAGVGADLLLDVLLYDVGLFTHTSAGTIRKASALFLGACWPTLTGIGLDKIKNWRKQ
jgi:hypothetical protein